MPASIIVVGSTNTDMVIRADRIPRPGETILGGSFFLNPGGKGANQAVAAARAGGTVVLVAKKGNDLFGDEAALHFRNENIGTDYLFTDPAQPSGVALITVDARGENSIVVAQGANATLSAADVDEAAHIIVPGSTVLLQLEVPLPTVVHAAMLAMEKGATVVLNPAPACALPDALYRSIHIITPNETEAELLTGIAVADEASAARAAAVLQQKGVGVVIITMGARGAYMCSGQQQLLVPAPTVDAIDTTAAGDVFNGALVVALSEGRTLHDAVAFACGAAAMSVTRMGAQASAPYRHEVDAFVQQVVA